MLREIRIRNLAIVEDAVIPFGAGLNVMTGSTGAGKSIILAAAELLSGSRAKKSLIRKGAESLVVEGIFVVDDRWPLRDKLGMNRGESELSIRRELAADGRNRIWINGMLSTVSLAQDASGALLELHGQHLQQSFLDPANHIAYLDAWGDYGELVGSSMAAIERYGELAAQLKRLVAEDEEHRRREDFLRFQLAEIEDLKLEPGLDKRIESRMRQLEHRQKFVSALDATRECLEGEGGGAAGKLAAAIRSLESIASIDAIWHDTAEGLRGARISVQEVARAVTRALAEADETSEDVEDLQRRLAGMQRLFRKHGLDCEGLIRKRDEIRDILKSIDDGSTAVSDATCALAAAHGELIPMLEKLSRARVRCAARLDRHVTEELQRLGMKGALFTTHVERLENSAFQEGEHEIHLSPRGWDRVEFMLRTNVGEETHRLADIASGGELSRITLVLKKLEVEEKSIPTLVFDEIDAGLGADLGGVVAERLGELSERYQIVCITHLPQVAAKAGHHIRIAKRVKDSRTIASAKVLEGSERIAEIARMLGGTGKLREELAEELLEKKQGRP